MIDYKRIAADLLRDAPNLVRSWLPGGKQKGIEYVCANLAGGQGESCSINTATGKWADFAADKKGGDLLSLYAAIHNLRQPEAAAALGFTKPPPASRKRPVPPPEAAEVLPPLWHPANGKPSRTWRYNDPKGNLLFYVARYDKPDGKKEVIPWTYKNGGWEQGAMPVPRPLYNLDLLRRDPEKPVLIVEGEKTADAAQQMLGADYTVTTWPGGTNAADRVDWRPIKGRKVLIWPDADPPGRKAAAVIYCELMTVCPEIKVVDTKGQPEAWDAADAAAEGWALEKLKDWLATRITLNFPDADLPPQQKHQILWGKMGLVTTTNGHPIPNLDNAAKIIEKYPPFQGLMRFDEFKGKYINATGSEWGDSDTVISTIAFQRELGFNRLSDETVHKALSTFARRNPINAPKDWLETLKWDGEARIRQSFCLGLGATDSDYTQAVASNFWISLVARVYLPGCRCDNMVVLEGRQGIGKTEALRIIGGPWYTDMHYSLTDKDFYNALRGVLLVEIAELDSFSRVETTKIKQVVTSTVDRYREPYARAAQDFPRRCIFVGTTNEDDYLRDNTGARRFWPIRCDVIDLAYLRRHRDQLFAEAVVRLKANEAWHHVPYAEANQEQESRRRADAWEDIIGTWLIGQTETTIQEIAKHCLIIDAAKLDMMTQKRIGSTLRMLKWERGRDRTGRKIWVDTQIDKKEFALR